MKKDREISKKFGLAVCHFRKTNNYTYKFLEEITGISASYICRIERGERKCPSIGIAKILAKSLRMPQSHLSELLELEEDNDSDEKLPEVEELLLFQDYCVNGEVLILEGKEVLSEIVSLIIGFEWKKNTIAHDVILLSGKIEEFKEGCFV